MVDVERRELDRAVSCQTRQDIQQHGGIEPAGEAGAHAGTRRQQCRDASGDVRAQVYSATSLNLP